MAIVREGSLFPLIVPMLAVAVGLLWGVTKVLRKLWPQYSGYLDSRGMVTGCFVMLLSAFIVAAYGAHSLTSTINEWLAATFSCLLYAGLVGEPTVVLATRLRKCNMIWVTLGVVPIVLLVEFFNSLSGTPTFEAGYARWLRLLPSAVPYIVWQTIVFCIGARIPVFRIGGSGVTR